jgi:kumamolisin
VLAPRNGGQLQSLLAALQNPASPSYHHWLAKGQFAARFAPSAATRSAVTRYLVRTGLAVRRSSSPFLIRATGSSARISRAFRTELRTYRGARGAAYFSNASAIQLPAGLARAVVGVVGLTNTIRLHSNAQRATSRIERGAKRPNKTSDCETPYPTVQQLVQQYIGNNPFPYGYGDGPGCSGLTPSQDNSIYNAPNVGPRGQGAGVNVAVFELSAYQHSDIATWAHQFYGRRYNPPLLDINVDGGPLNPQCPAGDQCPPDFEYYAGDIEVDADIEMSLAISPAMRHMVVYNAPNDETGQTELDEYTAIANQDLADTISSSWGVCENDVTPAYAQAENLIFEQMASQGQSLFTSSGDTGAFGCIRTDGSTVPNVGDPGGQPYITDVGGTSFTHFNPGHDPTPSYPYGEETVWNVDGLCNTSPNEYGASGLDWCAIVGAGGGGNSEYWGRPSYQRGPGVNNRYTSYNCSLARKGTPCREVPDISVNADEFTPYSEYCTGSAATPNSVCATFSSTQVPPGWFGIGGTSLSSPFMAAIIADRDSYTGRRTGLANPLLYAMFNQNAGRYFHDIGAFRQFPNNNGLYPTTPGYDEATGIGSPIMAPIITAGGRY